MMSVNIRIIRSGQAKSAVKIRDEKVHVSISKPLVLSPYKTCMIEPLYTISKSGPQVIVGYSQIAHLLVSVSLQN